MSLKKKKPAIKWLYKWSESHSVVSNSLQPHGLYSPWKSPGQKTGVGSHSLLQGIFPTQGSHTGLLHCRRILYQLRHQGSPRILEWVAYPFSSGSSRPRNQTGVSCIPGRFFTSWASGLAPNDSINNINLQTNIVLQKGKKSNSIVTKKTTDLNWGQIWWEVFTKSGILAKILEEQEIHRQQ